MDPYPPQTITDRFEDAVLAVMRAVLVFVAMPFTVAAILFYVVGGAYFVAKHFLGE